MPPGFPSGYAVIRTVGGPSDAPAGGPPALRRPQAAGGAAGVPRSGAAAGAGYAAAAGAFRSRSLVAMANP